MTRRDRLYNYGNIVYKNKVTILRKLSIAAVIGVMTLAVYSICFLGRVPVQSSSNLAIRIVSPIDFDFQSDTLTKIAKEKEAEKVAPSYDITKFADDKLNKDLQKLVDKLNEWQQRTPLSVENLAEAEDTEIVAKMSEEEFLDHIKRTTGFNINAADLPYILSETTPQNRQKIFWLILTPLKEIINAGIYDDTDANFAPKGDGYYDIEGAGNFRRSKTQARKALKMRINDLGLSDSLSDAFYRIFNSELKPNIVYNEAKTQKNKSLAREKVKPVIVHVAEGDIISDPSMKSDLAFERLRAYQKELERNRERKSLLADNLKEFVVSFLMVFSAALFIKISKSSQTRKTKTVLLFSTLLLFNLVLQRVLIQLTDSSPIDSWLYILAMTTPIVIGPILQALLCSAYTAFVMTLIITVLTTLMLAHSIPFFVISFAASLVAIYYTNGARTRGQVMMGGILYGLTLAVSTLTLGAALDYDFSRMISIAFISILTGIGFGILATVLLPLLERIFKISSNITLLEFTDYNNPLLRMLQMEAPGTYHHSLMVAQIAEQAAVKIGANPLVCTVGGLYHDVGKAIKPEFFSENQANENPHDLQSPSMSALIIKSHIREGQDLAKRYKMPPPVIEAISQHHGNSIISYFYYKAMKLAGENKSKADLMQALRDTGIEESTFRHEGEKPQTTENAILMLADSCEAASRSLRRVTTHSIEELVDKIFQSKMDDRQLDESPITLKQIAKVRESFIFTLQNMLHSRVEYNSAPAVLTAPKTEAAKETSKENLKSNELESQKPQD